MASITTNAAAGTLFLLDGHNFTTQGPLTNCGFVVIGPDSQLTVTGAYIQAADALTYPPSG